MALVTERARRATKAATCAALFALTATGCFESARPPLDREAFIGRVQERGYDRDQANCIVNRLISVYGDRVYGNGQIATTDPEVVERYVRAYAESC